jgi:NAD(P)-dependent dehydrogenase (short-subunit alcohol dehydrogenase family)
MDLTDQVAVVTGGGGGIGEGVCLCLSKAGAHVVVSDINEELARSVSAKIVETGRRSLAVKTDVRHEDECDALVETTLKEMGRLDILVCSAGTAGAHLMVAGPGATDVENLPLEVWDLTVDVNLKGVFLCNRAVIPHFKKQKRGKIINISSVAGRQGGPNLPIYAASKAGVINLTQSIAIQLAPYNVNVNTICPGIIWTPLWAEGVDFAIKSTPELKDVPPEQVFDLMIKTAILFKRPQTPEDIGNLAVFLSSAEGREITGQAINVDGGQRLN